MNSAQRNFHLVEGTPHIATSNALNPNATPFLVGGLSQSTSGRKDGSGEKDGLSVHAKPWSPIPESETIGPSEYFVEVASPSWTIAKIDGREVAAPSPMVSKEFSHTLLAHPQTIKPKGTSGVELEFMSYLCGRCPLKTLFGKLSSRKADVTLMNVAVDVPPLCLAHLVEQVTTAKVTALYVNDAENFQYELWLDKPTFASQVVETVTGALWTCPMLHGYAVVAKDNASKKFLSNYVQSLKEKMPTESLPPGAFLYSAALIDAKDH